MDIEQKMIDQCVYGGRNAIGIDGSNNSVTIYDVADEEETIRYEELSLPTKIT